MCGRGNRSQYERHFIVNQITYDTDAMCMCEWVPSIYYHNVINNVPNLPTYARVDIHVHVYLPWSAVCTVHRFINLSLNILKHTVKTY